MHEPAHALTTARMTLTPFVEDDGPELFHLFRDPQVRGFLLDDALVSPAWIQDEIDESRYRFRRHGGGLWSVRLTGGDEIIGFVGFRELFAPPELNLLYGFLPAHWGKGYAGEVTARVCAHAFEDLGFDEITAATDAPNRGSVRVLERLGMQLVGALPDGTLQFALPRAAWAAARGRDGA